MAKCLRTFRDCEGGAFDGKDGLGVDCPRPDTKGCFYRKEEREIEEDKHCVCYERAGVPCSSRFSEKGFHCTRGVDHEGSHVACGSTVHRLATWE